MVLIGFIFFIYFVSNLSISSLDTIIGIIGLKNNYFISPLIFDSLSSNSLSFKSEKAILYLQTLVLSHII